MKILFVTIGFPDEHRPANGIFNLRSIEQLGNKIEVAGVIHLQAWLPKRKIFKVERIKGLRVYRLRMPQLPVSYFGYFAYRFNQWVFSHFGFFWIRKLLLNIDLLHCICITPTGRVGLQWQAKSAKEFDCIIQVIGSDFYRILRRYDHKEAISKAIQKTGLQFNSKVLQEDFFKWLGRSDIKSKVIYRGVDSLEFKLMKEKANGRNKLNYLFLGGVQSYHEKTWYTDNIKGIAYLIDAWKAFVKGKEDQVKLFIGGPSTDHRLLQYLEEDYRDSVEVIGMIEPNLIPKVLNSTDVLIIPSISEGLPNLCNEAQACEVPVLGTSAGGVPETIDHLHTGFIASLGSADELLCGLNWFFENKAKIRTMGKAARQQTLRRASWSQYSEGIIELKEMLD